MSLFAVANLALGAYNAFQQNKAAEAAARAAQRAQDQIREAQMQDFYTRQGVYKNDDASGAFDPTAQIKLNTDTVGHDLRQGVGNFQAGAIDRGYKMGDSLLQQQPAQMSEAANLHLAQMNQSTRDMARRNRMSELAFASPNNLMSQIPSYQNDYNNAQRKYVDPSSLLGNAMNNPGMFDFLKSGGGGISQGDPQRPGQNPGDWDWLNNIGNFKLG